MSTPWWLGFRQIKVKIDSGTKYSPGSAVVCGPYQTERDAQEERMKRLSKEWDATYSQPFHAADEAAASVVVEFLTPIE